MAEGGSMEETTDTSPLTTRTGDDDDDDAGAGAGNNVIDWDNTDLSHVPAGQDFQPSGDTDRTQPFEPGATSTPSGGGEEIPMTTRTMISQEQQGLRTAETSFGGEPTRHAAWSEIKGEFEMADESKLKARYKTAPRAGGGGGGAIIEVAMKEKDKWYPLYTKSRGDVEKSFNESLPKEIKTALGKSLDEQFNDTNAALQAKQNELAAKRNQLEQAEQRADESQKLKRDMDALTEQIKDIDAQIEKLEDKHGRVNEDTIQKLKDDKRQLEGDKQTKRQQLSQLQKNAKQADKIPQRGRPTHARQEEARRPLE